MAVLAGVYAPIMFSEVVTQGDYANGDGNGARDLSEVAHELVTSRVMSWIVGATQQIISSSTTAIQQRALQNEDNYDNTKNGRQPLHL